MTKVLTVFGTRPEAIKLGPVVNALETEADIECRVAVTGQHRAMLDQMLGIFEIAPTHDLDIMRDQQHPLAVMNRAVSGLLDVYEAEKPDWVLVQGDTTTTFAAALAAFHFGCKVGHVEAGLRSFDKKHPFPEEVNRRLTSVVADFHFAPTSRSRENLMAEGISRSQILVTGNTVVDSLEYILKKTKPSWPRRLHEVLTDGRQVVLMTVHRRESWGEPLERVCQTVRQVALDFRDVAVVLPVHPNPAVSKTVRDSLAGLRNVLLLEPMDYPSFAHLIKAAYLVLTDSGGLQEEAVVLGVPGLVLRGVTERPEGVETGGLRLVGTDSEAVASHLRELLSNTAVHERMRNAANPYGDGLAANRIVQFVARGKASEFVFEGTASGDGNAAGTEG